MLENLKVVELASVLAGPAVGMFFAELGAEVIKIENKRTGGDVTRHWKLPVEDREDPYSAYYHSVNWGKKTMLLDLRQPADYQQAIDLIKKADVVISNYKPGSAEELNLDADTLRKLNPALIYASISAYGEDDLRPGFDVVIQAETGWMSMNGEPAGPPVKMPVALMDILAAHQLKEGILVALLKRQQTGEGCQVSVSLFDAGVASLANQAANWLNAGHLPRRMGSQHPNIAPYGDIFPTADGVSIIVSAATEKQYRSLLDCLDISELKADERFADNTGRLRHRSILNEYLAAAFQKQVSGEILERCHAAEVPVAPIRNVAEVFELPAARDLILDSGLPDGRQSRRVRTAVFRFNHEI